MSCEIRVFQLRGLIVQSGSLTENTALVVKSSRELSKPVRIMFAITFLPVILCFVVVHIILINRA
jgi:hypothetical protein